MFKLLEGGYLKDIFIVVIYKVIWVDEKIVKGILSDIVVKVKENNINKIVLIMVGRFLGEEYNNLKLYDKDFKYEYRG